MTTPEAASWAHSALGVAHAEDDDVGLHGRRVELDARQLGQPLGEHARVLVVLGQAVDVVVERPQRPRGDDAGLAQRAAEHLLVAPGLVDGRARAGQHRAHRRPEALGEVEPGGVEALRPLGGRHTAGHHGVHQARAVHVQAQAVGLRDVDDVAQLRERPHVAAGEVRGLLDRDEPGARVVAVAGGAHGGGEGVGVEHAALALQRAQHRAGDRRGAARLGLDRMRDAVQVGLVAAGADVQPEADRVAHRARGQEDRGLEAEQLGHALAQAVDGRVAEVLLVAHLGLGHRPAHLRRRPGLGVGVEVDAHRRRHASARPAG